MFDFWFWIWIKWGLFWLLFEDFFLVGVSFKWFGWIRDSRGFVLELEWNELRGESLLWGKDKRRLTFWVFWFLVVVVWVLILGIYVFFLGKSLLLFEVTEKFLVCEVRLCMEEFFVFFICFLRCFRLFFIFLLFVEFEVS